MKNYFKAMMIGMIAMIASATANAAMNDALVTFSTKGPDTYADGSAVMAGEIYALVWARNGFEFAGVDLDGHVIDKANNEVIVALPLAKTRKNGSGFCPVTIFQIDAEFAATHSDGSYMMVLFDTRVSDGKGGLVPSGKANQVQGWGLIENSRIKATAGSQISMTNAGGKTGVAVTTASAEPADLELPTPKITSISVKDGMVTLKVKGTSNRLLYNIAAGMNPGVHSNRRAASMAVQGNYNAEREITITTPLRKGENFFQIVRN